MMVERFELIATTGKNAKTRKSHIFPINQTSHLFVRYLKYYQFTVFNILTDFVPELTFIYFTPFIFPPGGNENNHLPPRGKKRMGVIFFKIVI